MGLLQSHQTVEKERTAKLIQKNSSSLVKNITSLLMSFFIYVAFVINAKSRYFIHFAYFVIAHCRTFVLPASRFLVCVHFRSSSQRVDFIDTLRETAYAVPLLILIDGNNSYHSALGN